MTWKSFIKSFIPPIPFLPSTKSLILGLTRSDFKPIPIDDDQYLFIKADSEKDSDDIIAEFPLAEFGFDTREQLREEVFDRFRRKIPCFIVREKNSNLLLGGVWLPAEGFGFLSRRRKHAAEAVCKVVNLFIVPERRVRGLGKQLLSFAVERIFATTDCERVVSQVIEREDRLPSLLLHMKIGFSIFGTLTEQKLFGVYLPHFVRKNTHPFFHDFPKTPAIVLTHDGANPLGIARSLGRHGVSVYVLTPDRNTSIAWSRYVKKVLPLTSLKNPVELKERLEGFLHEIAPQANKPILIVTNESHYLDLEPIKEFVEEHFNLVNPLEKVIPLSIKNNQFPLAAQAGFRVMETVLVRNTDDIVHVENKLAFPVIVRPMSDKIRDKLEMKTALYENRDALREHLTPMLTDNNVELIAQEYILGADRDVVFFMASCDVSGNPRLWLAGRKVRQNPPGRGVMASGIVDAIPEPVFIEKSKELCRLFGLRGFIGIECKQHAVSKEYVYIESSFRPEGFNSIGLAAGVDLVWDSYLAALGMLCGAVRPEKHKGSWRCGELEHGTMKLLRQQGDPDWWKVLIPLPRPVAYAFFTWDDPLPFFHSISILVMRKITGLTVKISKKQTAPGAVVPEMPLQTL